MAASSTRAEPRRAGRSEQSGGQAKSAARRPAAFTGWKSELPTNVYRTASNGHLPEVAGNACFGGPKRNWLFVAAKQSPYAFYVNRARATPG